MKVYMNSRRKPYIKEFTDKSECLQAFYGTGGGNTPIVLQEIKEAPLTFSANTGKDGQGIVRTLTGDHNNRITDYTALILEPRKRNYDKEN